MVERRSFENAQIECGRKGKPKGSKEAIEEMKHSLIFAEQV